MKSEPRPDWVIATVWFMAGISASGAFWYFLGAHNPMGVVVSAVLTGVLSVVAIILHIQNDKRRQSAKGVASPDRLLKFVWDYPLLGQNESSWAVKESAVLLGNLGGARAEPALGVAIVATELALISFGDDADGRVDGCITWGTDKAETEPPYRILVEIREPSDYKVEGKRPDLRHTLAFGVILARAKKQYSYLESYLKLAMDKQQPDGGWPAEAAANASPVFAAFYAIEMLHLAISDPSIPKDIRIAMPHARANGIEWLMEHRQQNGLWSGGSLHDFTWSEVAATGWVLHRLAVTADLPIKGWRRSLDDALLAMIKAAEDPQTWMGATNSQRCRVEARVAAAVRRAERISGLSRKATEAVDRYKGAWKVRAEAWLSQLPVEEMDVATATFLIWGLVPEKSFKELGRTVLRAERKVKR